MTSRNKNIFAFATLTATAALGTALFAAGCGDSGDTTPAYPGANAERTINLKFTDKDALKTGKVDTLVCVITKEDGTRLYKTPEYVKIKNVPADKSPKSGKVDVNKDTYATFTLSDTDFKAVRSENATITAVYYNSQATGADKGKILGFSQDQITWYGTDDKVATDNDKKSYGEVGSVSFFLDAADVNHILSADPNIIDKDKTTTLAYKVKKVDKVGNVIEEANIIDFVTVDGGKYLTKDDATIVGQYKGAEYTKADGTPLDAKFNGGVKAAPVTVYVTGAKITGITVEQKYAGVLLPKKDKEADYAFGQTEVKGTNGSAAPVTYGVGQTTMEVTDVTWKVEPGRGEKPAVYVVDPENVTYVANVGTPAKAAKADEATVDGNKISFLEAETFEIVSTYKTDLAEKDGQVSGNKVIITPVQPEVRVGLSTKAKAEDTNTTGFESLFEVDKTKAGSETFKMYAQFKAPAAAGSFISYLFEIPEAIGFTYPKAVLLKKGTSDAYTVGDVAVADNQKKNEYKLDVKDTFDSSVNGEVEVGMGKDAAATKEAFKPYTDLVFSKLLVQTKP